MVHLINIFFNKYKQTITLNYYCESELNCYFGEKLSKIILDFLNIKNFKRGIILQGKKK